MEATDKKTDIAERLKDCQQKSNALRSRQKQLEEDEYNINQLYARQQRLYEDIFSDCRKDAGKRFLYNTLDEMAGERARVVSGLRQMQNELELSIARQREEETLLYEEQNNADINEGEE